MYCRIIGTPDTVTTDEATEAFSGNVVCLNIDELANVSGSLALTVSAGKKQISINAGNLLAIESENMKDTCFLKELTTDITSRKSIIFFDKDYDYQYPTSPTTGDIPYIYPAELCFKEIASLLDYMKPSQYAKRVMFSKMAETIAIEEGLQVYRLKADNSLTRVGKRKQETVVVTDCTPKKIQTYIQVAGGL